MLAPEIITITPINVTFEDVFQDRCRTGEEEEEEERKQAGAGKELPGIFQCFSLERIRAARIRESHSP
ncbi:hypothetical protein RUM43_010613 [Polyplax serrata]|uniref:Uncharacterized protein n=1 Tax=Polyplax serrata TaxID=468196 RepID=A0AAN8P4B8_POLSC